MERQVGIVKRNAATEVADQLKAMNAARGVPAGRMAGAPIEVMNGPRVRSAEMNAGPSYLTAEEQAVLDAKAREVGILPPLEPGDEGYEPPVVESNEGPVPSPGRQTAREFLAAQYGQLNEQFKVETPRLIDFKKIQGIDLVRNVAYVDGFEIPLTEEMTKTYKGEILQLAVSYVTEQLAVAIKELNLLPSQGTEGLNSLEGTKDEAGSNESETTTKV